MKKAAAITTVLLMVSIALLGGCTSSPAPTTPPATVAAATEAPAAEPTPQPTEAPPVTLKWALWDIQQTAYYQPLIDAYKAVSPNVTIEMIDLGSSDYVNMLQTQLSGGADFDVVCIKDIPSYANLVATDLLEPLNDYVASAGIDLKLYNGLTDAVAVDGKLYTLPFRSDFWVVYYNKDIFDEMKVPYPSNDMTVEDYDKLARKLVHGEGNDKVYGAHYHTWRSTVELFGILDGKHTVCDGGSYEWMKPYYEMVLSEQNDGVVMSYATAVSTSSHYRDLFYNRKIAMMNMGTWQIATQIMAVKKGDTDVANWGIVKYPHPAGIEAGTTIANLTGLSVSKAAPNKEEALKFVGWVSGPEGAKVVASTGTIPAIHTADVMVAIASMDGFPTDENSKAALETFKVYLEQPNVPKAGEINTVLNEEHTEIMNGTKTIDEGLAAMQKRVDEILQQ